MDEHKRIKKEEKYPHATMYLCINQAVRTQSAQICFPELPYSPKNVVVSTLNFEPKSMLVVSLQENTQETKKKCLKMLGLRTLSHEPRRTMEETQLVELQASHMSHFQLLSSLIH